MTRSASVQPRRHTNSGPVHSPSPPPPPSSFTPRILPSRPDDVNGVLVTEELGDGSGGESLTRSFRVEPTTGWLKLKGICKELPLKRTIHWRQNSPRRIPNDWHKAGILVQAVGDEQPTPCYRCSRGLGPFQSCVALRETNGTPSIHNGACANCITSSHSRNCTFRPDHNPIDVIHGRSTSVAPSSALTPSRAGTPNAFSRKRAAPSQSVPPPPSSLRSEAVPDAAKVDKEPNPIDPHLEDAMARAPKRARRRPTRQRRWSPELPPETDPESQDNTGPTKKQDGTDEGPEDEKKQQQEAGQQGQREQEENVRYEIPRAFREHRFVAFPDTLSPNEELAIGTALAEARAICDRLESRLRKLRRASWVEDAE